MESLTHAGQVRPDFLRPVIYLVIFFALTPLTIAVSFVSLLSFNAQPPAVSNMLLSENLAQIPRFGARVYAALPNEQSTISSSATPADARSEIIRQYLVKYNSPLVPYSDLFVAASDQYGLDSRLLVAIAQQESNLCKKSPQGSYNCWGWGIHSRGTLGFTDYPTAIASVAQGLKEDYIDKGLLTPPEIMSKYTPLSNGSWAEGVSQFMSEME